MVWRQVRAQPATLPLQCGTDLGSTLSVASVFLTTSTPTLGAVTEVPVAAGSPPVAGVVAGAALAGAGVLLVH